jgi:uncharacterized membrane protein YeaQ/YmgE (transglycosylase-associated protein family)
MALNSAAVPVDRPGMGRSVTGLGGALGLFVGGYIPEFWGASSFSLSSILFGVLGGVAGVWLGVRLSEA